MRTSIFKITLSVAKVEFKESCLALGTYIDPIVTIVKLPFNKEKPMLFLFKYVFKSELKIPGEKYGHASGFCRTHTWGSRYSNMGFQDSSKWFL